MLKDSRHKWLGDDESGERRKKEQANYKTTIVMFTMFSIWLCKFVCVCYAVTSVTAIVNTPHQRAPNAYKMNKGLYGHKE